MIGDLESQLREYKASRADLEAALDNKEHAINKLLDNNEKLQEEVAGIEQSLKASQDANNERREKILNQESEVTDLTKALENATSDHVKATIDLQTLQKQCESLEDKLLHQEELNSALQGQVNDGLHQNEM